jgi:hypothetical protein
MSSTSVNIMPEQQFTFISLSKVLRIMISNFFTGDQTHERRPLNEILQHFYVHTHDKIRSHRLVLNPLPYIL